MIPGLPRVLIPLGGVVAGYFIVMLSQPTRASFRDGWRCVARYKRLCAIPFTFAACHAAFTLWVRYDEVRALPAPPFPSLWTGWHAVDWRDVLTASWLPATESLASVFNCAVTTFPLSALWGFLFLGNWRGYQALLGQRLRRRFGVFFGLLIHAAMLVCALAACAKPILFGRLTWLNAMADQATFLKVGEGINWLSFLFEYVIGVGVQVYLLLLAFAWIRGLTFDSESLRRFALRRWVLVLRWAAVLLLVSSLGINLPLLLSNFARVRGENLGGTVQVITLTRWLLAGGLIVFCSVQLFLVFHNDNLGRACAEHFRLLKKCGWQVGWFALVAALHFLALAASNVLLPQALGEWTWPLLCWKTLVYPLLWAVLSAWALATWVCLFRRCEAGQPEADDLVRF